MIAKQTKTKAKTNLGALGLDDLKRSTNDGALDTLSLSGLLLGSLLGGSLLVQATVNLGPGNLARIALHKETCLGLAAEEDKSLEGGGIVISHSSVSLATPHKMQCFTFMSARIRRDP